MTETSGDAKKVLCCASHNKIKINKKPRPQRVTGQTSTHHCPLSPISILQASPVLPRPCLSNAPHESASHDTTPSFHFSAPISLATESTLTDLVAVHSKSNPVTALAL